MRPSIGRPEGGHGSAGHARGAPDAGLARGGARDCARDCARWLGAAGLGLQPGRPDGAPPVARLDGAAVDPLATAAPATVFVFTRTTARSRTATSPSCSASPRRTSRAASASGWCSSTRASRARRSRRICATSAGACRCCDDEHRLVARVGARVTPEVGPTSRASSISARSSRRAVTRRARSSCGTAHSRSSRTIRGRAATARACWRRPERSRRLPETGVHGAARRDHGSWAARASPRVGRRPLAALRATHVPVRL